MYSQATTKITKTIWPLSSNEKVLGILSTDNSTLRPFNFCFKILLLYDETVLVKLFKGICGFIVQVFL